VGENYTYTGDKNERTPNCVRKHKKLNPPTPNTGRGSQSLSPCRREVWREVQHLIKVLSPNQMIELVSESRCIECNICVKVCPTNVFDKVPNAPPTIARQSDCQTCFMCELYCPVDALYVAPEVEPLASINEQSLQEAELLGSYRKNIGWGKSLTNTAKHDSTYQLLKKMK